MLNIENIFDFYGLSCLTEKDLDEEANKLYRFYLEEIRQNYVKTLKKRIIEEAGYMQLDIEGSSVAALLKNMKSKIDEEIKRQANKMAATGAGFNMMDMVKASHASRPKGMENAAEAFRSDQGKSRTAFGGEPWAKISEAFVAIENANSPKETILAIDHLNALQHNTCHVLFDISGTRGGGSGHSDIRQILDEKFKARTPKDFASKMSSDVRSFLKDQGVLGR